MSIAGIAMTRRVITNRFQCAVAHCAGVARKRLLRYRRAIVVLTHSVASAGTSYFAFWLRFDGAIPDTEVGIWWRTLPWLLGVRALAFVSFRLYEGLWRYTSVWDLKNLVMGVGVGTAAFYFLVHWHFNLLKYPRSVFIIDSMLLVFLLGGLRLLPRLYRDVIRPGQGKRILIFGAGDAGEMLVRDMLKDDRYQPVGFLDDDRHKVGHRIHGIPVLGTRADLPRAIARTRPAEILVAVSRRDLELVRGLVSALQPFKVPITTIPTMRHLIDGKVDVNQIRRLSIEDLLARAPIGLDERPVRELIEGKCVMVTGAGGSIGSELCRQVASFEPSLLVLFERYENSLYAVEHDLRVRAPYVHIEAVIGDVTDVQRLNMVLATYKPAIILHAAAHKHVPLMEFNCCEAVKNNITGTRRVAEAAQRHNVERFILISTDKAVNPSSVMGATKRVAELVVQAKAPHATTRFTIVRFGNVLGSNGSVVPRFVEQIRAGGPVTVTDPEVRRYFMLISEAVQLVLHAAALGERTDMYVLDMGEQIRLVDLAQNLIRLAGFIPEKEIRIEYVGLRPGEKLSEELTGPDEAIEPSRVEKVLKVRTNGGGQSFDLKAEVAKLTRFAHLADAKGVVSQLCRIVPTFRPDQSLLERVETARRARPAVLKARNPVWAGTTESLVPHTRQGARPATRRNRVRRFERL